MFDDILGSKEEFYDGDENPIEFEYEDDVTEEDYPPKYGGSDEEGIDFDGLDESMKKVIRDFINQHGGDCEEEEEECDDCDNCKPEPGPAPDDKMWKTDDLLSCRVCRQRVSVPKAVHQHCYEKLVKENKWRRL
jgi:hypothetical protein